MRTVVQRVSSARVEVEGRVTGSVGRGLLVLVGIGRDDGEPALRWMAEKVANLRIFEDEEGKMNRSVLEVGGEVLAVSQFTLYGDCRRGRRPSFTAAAEPARAQDLYARFVEALRSLGLRVEEGVFQAHMQVHLVNDGPVTLIVDTP